MTDQFPKKSSTTAICQFLQQANQLPVRSNSNIQHAGKLIFALDATASRQPSWDRACHLQGKMFASTKALGGLQVQLCYFCGFHEFYSTPWYRDSRDLLKTMSAVQCLGGYTQINRVLDHALTETQQQQIHAVIMIGDAMEEDANRLCAKAGQLGLLNVPLFMFQEGSEPNVRRCFQKMAHLSKGAYASFDENSADYLAELLNAVATFASGGSEALQRLQSATAQQLFLQLKK